MTNRYERNHVDAINTFQRQGCNDGHEAPHFRYRSTGAERASNGIIPIVTDANHDVYNTIDLEAKIAT